LIMLNKVPRAAPGHEAKFEADYDKEYQHEREWVISAIPHMLQKIRQNRPSRRVVPHADLPSDI
jgi:hypothetical protein